MSNNRDFDRKHRSLIDVGEFYSDNLVIFTETDEDRWERFHITNPIASALIIEIFGPKDAKLLLPHMNTSITEDKLIKIVKDLSDTTNITPRKVYPSKSYPYRVHPDSYE